MGNGRKVNAMPELIVDKSLSTRLELADAEVTARYARAYAELFPGSGATVRTLSSGCVSFAGSRSPLSRAVGLGMAHPVTEADLDTVEEFFWYRGSRAIIDVCPFADDSLVEIIGRRNYKIFHFLNLFVTEVSKNGPSHLAPIPHISISQVDRSSVEDGETWALTVARGFAGMDDGTPPDLDIFRCMFRTEGTLCFLAKVDGKVAGGGALKIVDHTAMLSTAATLPSFRKHGVQSGLLRARLQAAATAGCDLATVMINPGNPSHRNIVRAGFSMAYTRITLVRSDPLV